MSKQKKKESRTKKDMFSYFLLTLFLLIFVIMIFYEKSFNLYVLLTGIVTAFLLYRGFLLAHKMPIHKRYEFLEHYNVIIACLIGAVLTYFLSVNLNLGVVISASFVGLVAVYTCKLSKIVKDLSPPIYCGAFVGMVSPLILPNILFVAIAGIIAGIIYYLSHYTYTGIGGKLGTIAFVGVTISVFILKLIEVLW